MAFEPVYIRRRAFSAPPVLVTVTTEYDDLDDVQFDSFFIPTPTSSPPLPDTPLPSSPTLPPCITSGIVIVNSSTYSGNPISTASRPATSPVALDSIVYDSSWYLGNLNSDSREVASSPVASNTVIDDSSTDVGNSNSTCNTVTKDKQPRPKPNLFVTIPPTPTYLTHFVKTTADTESLIQPDAVSGETGEVRIVKNRAEPLTPLTGNAFATSSTDAFTTTTFMLESDTESKSSV